MYRARSLALLTRLQFLGGAVKIPLQPLGIRSAPISWGQILRHVHILKAPHTMRRHESSCVPTSFSLSVLFFILQQLSLRLHRPQPPSLPPPYPVYRYDPYTANSSEDIEGGWGCIGGWEEVIKEEQNTHTLTFGGSCRSAQKGPNTPWGVVSLPSATGPSPPCLLCLPHSSGSSTKSSQQCTWQQNVKM